MFNSIHLQLTHVAVSDLYSFWLLARGLSSLPCVHLPMAAYNLLATLPLSQ